MEPYFGQRITSMFAGVSTSQNINTGNSSSPGPGGKSSRGARAAVWGLRC